MPRVRRKKKLQIRTEIINTEGKAGERASQEKREGVGSSGKEKRGKEGGEEERQMAGQEDEK